MLFVDLQILRMMIHKKIYPGSSVSTSTKKYLEDKHMEKVQESDKGEERGEDRCKWVKTDSDCKFTYPQFKARQINCSN